METLPNQYSGNGWLSPCDQDVYKFLLTKITPKKVSFNGFKFPNIHALNSGITSEVSMI